MESNEIIQLMGVLYFVIGLSFLFNKKYYITMLKEEVIPNILVFVLWFMALVLGFVMLIFFHEFTLSREWLVSVIWWMSFLKWLMLILFPKMYHWTMKFFSKHRNYDLITFFVIVVSILLLYLGYVA